MTDLMWKTATECTDPIQEEKLSLVNRFGVTINYSKPSQKEYFEIVFELARKAGINMGEDELKAKQINGN